METVKEILDDTRFVEWTTDEQEALSSMIANRAKGRSARNTTSKTDRVWTTFIRILAVDLKKRSMSEILEAAKFDEWSAQEQKELSEMNLGICSDSDIIRIQNENGRVMATFNEIARMGRHD